MRTIGDDGALRVPVFVVAGDSIRFAYRSGEDEKCLRRLVERCADALDRTIERF